MFAYTYPHKICDRIHGFIRFDDLEKRVIDSRPFQRLRYIHQMGTVFLVYPGATHNRFEHSLGVMELASRSYDSMLRYYNLLPQEELNYWRRILRLAALCHDMGHLPFSHTAERSLLPYGGHEKKTVEFIQSPELKAIWKEFSFGNANIENDIIKLSVGDKTNQLTPWERVLSQVITDDNFGADRIDYLIRDAAYTGVGYGHLDYHQLIDTLRFLPSPKDKDFLAIGVSMSGLQSVESLWIARYLMYARVYHHPKARLYAFHMERFMKKHYNEYGFPDTLEGYIRETDYQILSSLRKFADLGDKDARALLKEGESYIDLSYEIEEEKIAKVYDILSKKLADLVSIDWTHDKEIERDFPVLKEGSIVSSKMISTFLRDIPLGRKKVSLFIDPTVSSEVKALL